METKSHLAIPMTTVYSETELFKQHLFLTQMREPYRQSQLLCLMAPNFDLAVSAPQINAPIGTGGLATASVAQPVQITVPVTGSGFNSPENRTTTVTVQAGSQSASQVISLASIQSAGTLQVPFTLTFGAQDVGTQTVTATVDPGNSLGESNFANNMASGQVQIQNPIQYQLIALVNGIPIPQLGGTLEVPPSVMPCGKLAGASQEIPVQILCVNTNNPSQTVSGCYFDLNLEPGQNNGGHNHNLNDGSRPLILDSESIQFITDTSQSVDAFGNSVIYTPPEVSGEVLLTISGSDPNGNSITGPSFTFEVKSPLALQELSADGLTITTVSHPGVGDYGTAAMDAAVAQMAQYYFSNAAQAGVDDPDELESGCHNDLGRAIRRKLEWRNLRGTAYSMDSSALRTSRRTDDRLVTESVYGTQCK